MILILHSYYMFLEIQVKESQCLIIIIHLHVTYITVDTIVPTLKMH